MPENGDYECTGIGELGTRCDFTCDAGYDMIGYNHTVCERKSFQAMGTWNNSSPKCKEGNLGQRNSIINIAVGLIDTDYTVARNPTISMAPIWNLSFLVPVYCCDREKNK